MTLGSHTAGRFFTFEMEISRSISLACTCKYLLANEQTIPHEQGSFHMQIFCNLNTPRDY